MVNLRICQYLRTACAGGLYPPSGIRGFCPQIFYKLLVFSASIIIPFLLIGLPLFMLATMRYKLILSPRGLSLEFLGVISHKVRMKWGDILKLSGVNNHTAIVGWDENGNFVDITLNLPLRNVEPLFRSYLY